MAAMVLPRIEIAMKTHLAALLILVAPPAKADELPYLAPAETRYGQLTIGKTEVDWGEAQQLLLDGSPISGLVDRFLDVRAIAPRPDGDVGDWVLVSMANGGNGCPMMWAFVSVTPDGATATDSFGTCSEAVLNPRTTEEGFLALDIPSLLPEEEFVTFTYDGVSVSEIVVKRSNDRAVPAGAGDDVTRWIGANPTDPFADAGERLRFGAWMTEDEVYELAERVGVGSAVYEAEGWVIGEGFDPKAGGDIAGLWAIRIADGAVLALFRDTGSSPRSHGDMSLAWPQAMTDFAMGP
jgi:hypothetical protein